MHVIWHSRNVIDNDFRIENGEPTVMVKKTRHHRHLDANERCAHAIGNVSTSPIAVAPFEQYN